MIVSLHPSHILRTMHLVPASRRIRCWTAALAGGVVFAGATLGVRRVLRDCRIGRVEDELLAPSVPLERFSPGRVAGLPEPARRYLVHAIAPGTPLAPAVRLRMDGAMRPAPGGPQLSLAAEETLAPRRGFVWTARTRLFGLPVRVRDRYFDREGSVRVLVLGGVPLPSAGGADVTRSSRGRLVAEASGARRPSSHRA